MKQTKREALTTCRELWVWLAENPGKKKSEWPGWKKYGEMDSDCPCCEYNIYVDGGACNRAAL